MARGAKRDRITNSRPTATIQSIAEATNPSKAPEPEQALTIAESGDMTIGGYTLTSTGLIAHDATLDDWEQVGAVLFRLEGSIQLLIGDWLVEAEMKWGTTYKEIAESTGYNPKSLRTYRWVAGSVPLSMRMDTLMYSHYAVVAGIADEKRKKAVLKQAAAENWSVAQLRNALTPPALPEGESIKQLSLFDALREKQKQLSRMERLYKRAGRGDHHAYEQLLGNIAQMRKWLDEVEDAAGD
jgi:hypothetical protein